MAGATGYAVLKKPPRTTALGIMFIAGGVGTAADFIYGWTIGCQSQVQAWQKQKEQRK